MKRLPPRSDTLVSNLCETPLTSFFPNACRQACESDDARSCNAFTSSALHCLYDLETASSVLDVVISASPVCQLTKCPPIHFQVLG